MVKKNKLLQEEKKKKFKILAAGDIHGSSSIAKKLAEKAEKEKVDLVIITGDITGPIESKNLLKPFIEKNKKVVLVPGNWDSSETINFLSKLYGVKNVGEHYVRYGNIGIFGIGSPDWKLELDNKEVFKKLKREFNKIKNLEKKIMVSHLHPAGTKMEFSGILGNKGLRKAIEEFQPDLFISSHIHEAEGLTDKIGKTKLISVGKKGEIIEI